MDQETMQTIVEGMAPEDREKLIKAGNNQINAMMSAANPRKAVVEGIERQLRGGLHISDLEPVEVKSMTNQYGENWYERWGYTKEDLNDIVTTNPCTNPE